MTHARHAAVHVMRPPPPIIDVHQVSWWRRIGIGLGAAALLAGSAWLLLAAASASAAAGSGWRASGAGGEGQALQDAVPAGQEGSTALYPCRAMIKHDMHVGRIRADFNGCHIGFDGREMEIAPFDLLVSTWGSGTSGNAFVGGSERAAGAETPFEMASLQVCRAAYQGGVHPGQSKAGEKGCNFGFGGKKIVAQTYEVLQDAPWLTWSLASARNLPDTAIVGGSEGGEPFYVCRAADRNGLHPGKIKRNAPGCSIVSEGREAIAERFEALNGRWITGRAGVVPVAAYPAGREAGNAQYICRGVTREGTQVGKVDDSLGGCHIGMTGSEVVLKEYEVLSQ